MKGLIFNIKRFAIHDGPGIRTTFFMKGCPLDCWWCHNPEGRESSPRTVERTDRLGDREFRTTEIVGRNYTIDEIVKLAEKDKIFMEQSGGGVTFSGGEPLLQPLFLLETLVALKTKGFHTAVDTSGFAPPDMLKAVIPYTDIFLFDIKHVDDEMHIKYTGVSNEPVISNFKMLLSEGSGVAVRVPVIPGVTASADYMRKLLRFLESNWSDSIREVDLLPYHRTGSSKYRRFDIADRMSGSDQVSDSSLDEFIDILSPLGIAVKKGG